MTKFSENFAKILPKIVVNVSKNQKVWIWILKKIFFIFGKMFTLSMTSMTASYATVYGRPKLKTVLVVT